MGKVMTELGARPEDIVEGSRIRWVNSYGVHGEAVCVRVKGFFEAPSGVGVTFFSDRIGGSVGQAAHENNVALESITHIGNKRVRKTTRTGGQSPTADEGSEASQQASLIIGEEGSEMKSRKSMDEMSETHRAHHEFWSPHAAKMKVDFVWVAVSRYPQRGQDGAHYVAVKRGDKDYAIVDYNTTKLSVKSYKMTVVEDGFETSTAMMQAFKQWRATARAERDEARGKAAKAKGSKPRKAAATKKTATKKAATKKPAAKKKAAAKTSAAKKKVSVKRTKAPARAAKK